jgi:ABC-type amino acid transport system permease subunit
MSRPITKKTRSNRVSVLNWLGTLFVSLIPGVNIICWILFIIFCKPQPKRSFAIAAIVLTVLLAVLYCAAFFAFGDQLTQWAAQLAATVQPAP